jgi:hypothetical protein
LLKQADEMLVTGRRRPDGSEIGGLALRFSGADAGHHLKARSSSSSRPTPRGTPLAEDAEAYELEILDGPGGTVLRTATGITAASFVYTTAMQSADFGVAQTALTFRVYQISAQVGRAFASEDTTLDVT